jgi:hypothetical protein
VGEPADIATRTQRFNEVARAFTPPRQLRHANLIPMKGGIIELRQKRASLGLIRELLATVGVAVSTATIAQVLAKVSHNSGSARQHQPFALGRTPVLNMNCEQPASVSRANVAMTGKSPPTHPRSSNSVTTTDAEKPSERSRVRNLRIADGRNR